MHMLHPDPLKELVLWGFGKVLKGSTFLTSTGALVKETCVILFTLITVCRYIWKTRKVGLHQTGSLLAVFDLPSFRTWSFTHLLHMSHPAKCTKTLMSPVSVTLCFGPGMLKRLPVCDTFPGETRTYIPKLGTEYRTKQ